VEILSRDSEKLKMGSASFINNSGSWIIHGPRLLQRQGEGHEAVLVYREWDATKSMRQDWFARRVKIADWMDFWVSHSSNSVEWCIRQFL